MSSTGNVHWNLRLPPGLLEDLERLVERRERAMETQQYYCAFEASSVISLYFTDTLEVLSVLLVRY